MTQPAVTFLAHRGWWSNPSEKNAFASFERALAAGYGIETDIRDRDGALVISHDMPDARTATLEAFLDLYTRFESRPTLALNIKADGLVHRLDEQLRAHAIDNYFVFDMSIPDTLGYLRNSLPVFARRSEYETGSLLDGQAAGLWLDALTEPFVSAAMLENALDEGHTVALVSPELHGRPYREAWQQWHALLAGRKAGSPSCMICTDLPGDAARFFNGDAFQ